ncbi:fibromodulin-like [Gadus morhua]|uniref:Fibromodulin n=1 Tax=Gadus morhua TaxID=8049 RepID=A0A8C4ZNV8_GADMO|nr:fibromodulin-like [Gadus morhua]XP_030225703.1 fibromodulin-like [Gadus morhua]
MRAAGLLFMVCLVDLNLAQGVNQLQWLAQLRGRWRQPQALWANGQDQDCPLECDCPAKYPAAMYCHGRNLHHVPYVPSHIKYVYLQRNHITGIQDGVFDNATNLVWLVLFQNRLNSDKIGKNVFGKLRHLERLYLDHNELSRVPSNLPKSIKELRLGNNQISKIQAESFEGMTELASLQLHANVIEDVGGAFKGLKSLAVLDMRKNNLREMPKSLPESLHQLYLGSNKIESVPADFLSMHPKLQFLRLSSNMLTDEGIPSNVFNVSTLVELDLSHNKLERIPMLSRDLEYLYLEANRIKEFSLSSFCSVVDMTNFSKLRVLRLDANKISARDIPTEAVYCLRLAASINV